jgi:hypothetical protein
MKALHMAFVAALTATPALADDPAWNGSPYKTWYENAELTPAARAKFGIQKCCNQAEVVRTEFRKKAMDESWWYLDNSSHTWRRIPDFIIWEGKQPPGNRPTLFIWNRELTCFFPPDDEI